MTRRVELGIRAYYDNPGQLHGSTSLHARELYAERQVRQGLQLPVIRRRLPDMHQRSHICHFSTLNLELESAEFSTLLRLVTCAHSRRAKVR